MRVWLGSHPVLFYDTNDFVFLWNGSCAISVWYNAVFSRIMKFRTFLLCLLLVSGSCWAQDVTLTVVNQDAVLTLESIHLSFVLGTGVPCSCSGSCDASSGCINPSTLISPIPPLGSQTLMLSDETGWPGTCTWSVTICSVTWSDGSISTYSQDWGGGIGMAVGWPSASSYSVNVSSPCDGCYTNSFTGLNGSTISVANTGQKIQYYSLIATNGGCSPEGFVVEPGNISVNGQSPATGCPTSAPNYWLPVSPGQTASFVIVGLTVPQLVCCPICGGLAMPTVTAQLNTNSLAMGVGMSSSGCGGWTTLYDKNGNGIVLGTNVATVTNGLSTNVFSNVGAPSVTVTNSGATNNILWASTTATNAQNLTLEQGFSAVAGILTSINSDLLSGETASTYNSTATLLAASNQLGAILSNGVLLAGISNELHGLSGLGSNGIVGVTNWPSNYPDAAAIGYLSNLSSAIYATNGFGDGSGTALSLQSASNRWTSSSAGVGLANLSSEMSSALTANNSSVYSGGAPSALVVPLGFGILSTSVSFDPAGSSVWSDVASFLKAMIEWVVGVSVLVRVVNDTRLVVSGAGAWGQIKIPGLTPLVGAPVALAYVTAFYAVLGGVVLVLVSTLGSGIWSSVLSAVGGAPFSGSGHGSAVQVGLYYATFFFPMQFLVSVAISYLVFSCVLLTTVGAAVPVVKSMIA